VSVRPSYVDPGVSPELVLVDPALADDERRTLRAPDDTLDRLTAMAPRRNGHAVQALVSEARRDPAPEASPSLVAPQPDRAGAAPFEARGLRSPRKRVRLAAATVGAVALALLSVLALTSFAPRDDGSVVDTTASTVVTSPSVGGEAAPSAPAGGKADDGRGSSEPRRAGTARATPRGGRSAGPSRPAPASGARRLAWAPVAGASGYHVELFDGRSRVFSADTRRPEIVVPATWRLDGRTHRLAPGEYRWYVWPVASGRRATQAIVQARLDVPR